MIGQPTYGTINRDGPLDVELFQGGLIGLLFFSALGLDKHFHSH